MGALDRHADSGEHVYAVSDRDADAFGYAAAHRDVYRDGNQAHSHAFAYTCAPDAYRYAPAHSHGDQSADQYAHSGADGNQHGNRDGDGHTAAAYEHGDVDSYHGAAHRDLHLDAYFITTDVDVDVDGNQYAIVGDQNHYAGAWPVGSPAAKETIDQPD